MKSDADYNYYSNDPDKPVTKWDVLKGIGLALLMVCALPVILYILQLVVRQLSVS